MSKKAIELIKKVVINNFCAICGKHSEWNESSLEHEPDCPVRLAIDVLTKDTVVEPVRVGCTIIIHRHGNVLLGERGEDCETAKNLYSFPGGRMDYGETPEDSILRELFEETGLRGNKKDLKFFRYCNEFFPEQGKHYISLVFIMELMEGEPVLTEPDKCKGWEWIPVENLPKNTFEPCRESLMLAAMEILGVE